MGIPKTQSVYPADVALAMPRAATGRPRAHQVPTQPREAAEDVLAQARWRRVARRAGTKGLLAASFAAVRVVVANGLKAPQTRRLPTDAAWLVGEWRRSGERKYYTGAPRALWTPRAGARRARNLLRDTRVIVPLTLGDSRPTPKPL